LQSAPFSYLGRMHAGQTFGFACRGSSSDPAKSFQPISLRDEAIILSYIATDSDGGILQSVPFSYLGRMHAGQTFGFACRGSSSDPAKSFQPISLRDEVIVLSYIATDSDGGIYWGAFSVQGGAQTPQGFRSRAVEVRSGFRQTVFPLQQPGRIDWSSFEIIPTVEF